jgi:hypothetical protein
MKHILPLFLLGLLSTGLFAQTILVWDENGNALSNNSVITIHEESGHTDIFADFDVEFLLHTIIIDENARPSLNQ